MQERNLTIYFTSDLHSYIYPTDYRSQEEKDLGLFKCASQFQKDGNTLVIDGGDLLQGSPLGAFCHDTVGSAAQFAQIMNRCGYDYVTLGNHDFNYGMPYLDSYLDALRARCVCENVRWAGGGVRFPARVHVLDLGAPGASVRDPDQGSDPGGSRRAAVAEGQGRSDRLRLSRRIRARSCQRADAVRDA